MGRTFFAKVRILFRCSLSSRMMEKFKYSECSMNDFEFILQPENGFIFRLIIYIQNFLDSDWLSEMQFLGNTMQK